MELQGDVGHVKSLFGPFGDSAGVGSKIGAGLCETYCRLRKSFWMHPIVLLGDEAQVEA
jgi:hypothetical protein